MLFCRVRMTHSHILSVFSQMCAVPDDYAPAVCGRHLQPAELHELPALALHWGCGPGINLPTIY